MDMNGLFLITNKYEMILTLYLLHYFQETKNIFILFHPSCERQVLSNLSYKMHQNTNINVSCLFLQYSLLNALKPCVKAQMKM